MSDTKINIDFDDLTLDEIEDVEDILDGNFFEMLNGRRGKVLKAVALVMMRRSNPDITMEEVGQMRIRQLSTGSNEDAENPLA